MNWGKGITIFLILFITFITTLAVILMRANADLVSEDYYKKEVAYGDEIIAEENAIKSNAEVKTTLLDEGLHIQLNGDTTPDEFQIHLMRGNDPDQDIYLKSKGTSVFIEGKELSNGKYTLTITWLIDSEPYQIKKEIWVS